MGVTRTDIAERDGRPPWMTRASPAQRLGLHMLLGVAGRVLKIGWHWAPNCATFAFAKNPLSPDWPRGIPTIRLVQAPRLRTIYVRGGGIDSVNAGCIDGNAHSRWVCLMEGRIGRTAYLLLLCSLPSGLHGTDVDQNLAQIN
jgi:hypothetical protein